LLFAETSLTSVSARAGAASDVRPDEELHCWTFEVVGRLILTTPQYVFKLRMCTMAAVTAISHAIFACDFQTGS